MKRLQESKIVRPIFIGRWTPKVLFSLRRRPYRHGQLRRHIGSVSQRMLTRTLRNLESTGLITRRVTRARAIAVEYSLTQLGRNSSLPLEVCAVGQNDTAGTSVPTYTCQKRIRKNARWFDAGGIQKRGWAHLHEQMWRRGEVSRPH
jgi:DNA-binding HxlR family transcriptional regulator